MTARRPLLICAAIAAVLLALAAPVAAAEIVPGEVVVKTEGAAPAFGSTVP